MFNRLRFSLTATGRLRLTAIQYPVSLTMVSHSRHTAKMMTIALALPPAQFQNAGQLNVRSLFTITKQRSFYAAPVTRSPRLTAYFRYLHSLGISFLRSNSMVKFSIRPSMFSTRQLPVCQPDTACLLPRLSAYFEYRFTVQHARLLFTQKIEQPVIS